MDEAWLLHHIRARNTRETTPFVQIHESYNHLLLQVDTLQAKLEVSEREKASLQEQLENASALSGASGSSTTGGNATAYSAAIKNEARVRDRLEKLQAEYDQKIKAVAEEKANAVRLTKELDEVRAENTAHTTIIAQLKEGNAVTVKRMEHLTREYSEATSRAELAETQYNGLKVTIRALQKEIDDLQKQNRHLETRVVTEKTKLLSEMNSLTEMVEALNQERDNLLLLRSGQPKQENKKKSSWFGNMSPSTIVKPADGRPTTIEEDPMRKVGDIKVTLPTTAQFSHAAHSPEGICVRFPHHDRDHHHPSDHAGGASQKNDNNNDSSSSGVVITAGSDATVKVWDTSTGSLKTTFRGTSGHPFLSCDIAGHLVAGGSSDKTCRVWSLKTDRMMHHLVGHQHKVTAVRFCANGEAIVTASADHTLQVWDISRTTYKSLVTIRHDSTANSVDVGAGSFSAVSGHVDGGVRCWDLRTGDRTAEFKDMHEGGITSVQISPVDTTKVLTHGMDSTLKVIDLRTGSIVERFQDKNLSTTQAWSKAVWSPNGRYVAAGSNATGLLLIWNVHSGVLSTLTTANHSTTPTDDSVHTGICAVDWNLSQVATLDRRGKLILWS